ncbi:MAG: UDP-N-acetylmuramoyl-L-alanine--D-glutamate ligase [Patescibacteria group bacterium]
MIKNKKIAIFGLGLEGISAVNYLSKYNEIVVFDKKEKRDLPKVAQDLLGRHKLTAHLGNSFKQQKFDLVLRSPGVRPDDPKILKLVKNGARLTSATQIFFNEFKGQIIGVTGTKGKGTTSTLIFELLKAKFDDVHLAGNIGNPMLDLLKDLSPKSKVVLELSSFQLTNLQKSPHICVILMITSEHLNWHKNREEYINAKATVVANQTKNDLAIINQDFPASRGFAKKTKANVYFFSTIGKTNGVYIEGQNVKSNIESQETICSITQILLPGRHNLQNVCAGISVAKIMGVENKSIIKVLKTFKGLKHRLQMIKEVEGVKYYDDSFSTTPETTIAALAAFKEPKILILGGSSKKSDFTDLVHMINKNSSLKAVVLIGIEGQRLKQIFKETNSTRTIIEGPKNMQEIVSTCKNLALGGDIVLLSPACASFGMFKNYKDRGDQFIKEVNKL